MQKRLFIACRSRSQSLAILLLDDAVYTCCSQELSLSGMPFSFFSYKYSFALLHLPFFVLPSSSSAVASNIPFYF